MSINTLINQPQFILIHHSGVPSYVSVGTINKGHKLRSEKYGGFTKSKLGYNVGYHYYINDKTITQTRLFDEIGSHCHSQGMNFKSIGICLGGEFHLPNLLPNDYQKKQLAYLIIGLRAQFNLPPEAVRLHREFYATLCPGNITKELIEEWITEYYRTPDPDEPKVEAPKPKPITIPVIAVPDKPPLEVVDGVVTVPLSDLKNEEVKPLLEECKKILSNIETFLAQNK